ncbi:MAG: HAMP domain-containing histidine kinase [Sandaracinaceae bacterium]|nr:HAMP domain-containing histidine kinase [Sandaracinaceae bacterium]
MVAVHWFTLGASACFLGLAALAAVRAQRNPLALPLALLCADLFAYNSLDVLGSLLGGVEWEWLEAATASLAAPLMLHFILAFVGARRAQRTVLIASYVFFGALALASVSPLAVPAMRWFPSSDRWAQLMLLGVVPAYAIAAVLVVRHYRSNVEPEERARTQLLVGTVVIGVGGPATDLAHIAGATASPRLAAGGMLVGAILLTALALRFRLVRGATALLIVNVLLIGVVGVVAQIVFIRLAGERLALLALGTSGIILAILASARTVWIAFTGVRERSAYLTTLGRLSAQMAHDIRNPLAAIKGAAQYLQEERAQGRSLDGAADFVELILEQTERLDRVVQHYQRLGRAVPEPHVLDVAALLERVADGVRAMPAVRDASITIDVEAEPLSASLDEDLLSAALENLARNAVEAIGGKPGRVVLRAELERDAVSIAVTDDGPGMDARTRERATEEFFTTKSEGTGLGLAFVRRVAQAHGGRMYVESALGKGTTVRLVVPIDRRSAP